MTYDQPKEHSHFSWKNFLLLTFLLGLWLLGAISGMLFFNFLNFIEFRSKGHILILVLLVLGSISLMAVSYLFFPREKERRNNHNREG